MRHVDEGTLHALLDGALQAEAPEEARAARDHLDQCADCRARLHEAEEIRGRASAILADMDDPVMPDFAEVRARAAASAEERTAVEQGQVSSGKPELVRRYRWTRSVAWAATIVIALGTGWMVRDLAGPDGRVSTDSALERSDAGPAVAESAPLESPGDGAGDEEEPDMSVADNASAAREVPSTQTPVGEAGSQTGAVADDAPSGRAGYATPTEAQGAAAAEEERGVANQAVQLADVAEADGVVEGPAGTPWQSVSLAEAEALVGPLVLLPEAVVAAGPEARRDSPAVRTVQRLAGVSVEVIQEPVSRPEGDQIDAAAGAGVQEDRARPAAAETGESAARAVDVTSAAAPTQAGEAAPVEGDPAAPAELLEFRTSADLLQAVEANSRSTGVETVTVQVDGARLTLTGEVPADLLRRLAEEAAPSGEPSG